MRAYFGVTGAFVAGAIALVAPATWAAATQITSVRTNVTATGIQVVLETQNGQRPQVFSTIRGKSWVADVINTQLRLPGNMMYRQDSPAPGIASVEVFPLDANSVRVRITGSEGTPAGQFTRESSSIRISLSAPSSTATAPATTATPVAPANTTAQAAEPTQPTATPAQPTPAQPAAVPGTPVPNPNQVPPANINIAPPFLPRAVAPPIGDIAVSSIDLAPNTIDLGTAERVPRLVLREAPVREVLSLLARAAGLNIAFSEVGGGAAAAPTTPGTAATSTSTLGTVSLDIENEPVQDVFNYVLRLSGLQASRSGRTIFVGRTLPAEARGIIMRTIRLNQLKADLPQVTMTSTNQSQSSTQSSGGQGATNSQSSVQRTSQGSMSIPMRGALQMLADMGATTPTAAGGTGTGERILQGLQATADSRTNTVTLIGPPRLVDIATNYLTQLDIRKRQVAVNVKIVQVDLDQNNSLSSNFSFGIADNFFTSQGGVLDANFGPLRPAQLPGTQGVSPPLVPAGNILGNATNLSGEAPILDINTFPGRTAAGQQASGIPGRFLFNPPIFQYPTQFLLSLRTSLVNQNAKILTDPTLIVQEGTTSQVNLTSQVLTNLQQQIIVPTTGSPTVSLTTQFTDVGVILNVAVEQIDDNGFVTLALSPEVSAPGNPINLTLPGSGGGSVTNQVVPVTRRRLETGSVRLRDGQTLILTGIISEQETVNATKVPILGDLPLIGALFRGTETSNSRTEVVVMVTPQVMDDSQQSGAGYGYIPSPDVRGLLERGRIR